MKYAWIANKQINRCHFEINVIHYSWYPENWFQDTVQTTCHPNASTWSIRGQWKFSIAKKIQIDVENWEEPADVSNPSVLE